jgi:uncharacterized protein with NRDE domain
MCIIAWNWQPESDLPLLVVANRDEYYSRPTLPLHRWPFPSMFAGKDLHAGGTWLAVDDSGRFAGITNYRYSSCPSQSSRTRGAIIPDFFQTQYDPNRFIEHLSHQRKNYEPFNLLLHDGNACIGYESISNTKIIFSPGINVVSNGNFKCIWPKSQLLKSCLKKINFSNLNNLENLFTLLKNKQTFPLDILPNTGLSSSMEIFLSSIFIKSEIYGTRSSTIYIMGTKHFIISEIVYDNKSAKINSFFKMKKYPASLNEIMMQDV